MSQEIYEVTKYPSGDTAQFACDPDETLDQIMARVDQIFEGAFSVMTIKRAE